MGGSEAWAGSTSALTLLVCTPATPLIFMDLVPLTWHSTLYNRHPLHTRGTWQLKLAEDD
jgi:hypothetical protein